MRIRSLALVTIVLLGSGCYHATIDTGVAPAADTASHVATNVWLGTITSNENNTAKYALQVGKKVTQVWMHHQRVLLNTWLNTVTSSKFYF